MKVFEYKQLEEKLYYEKMPNGLEVFVLPKKDFKQTYAILATKYGSIDNHFQVPPGEEIRVVDGIAHFLEHKMFEQSSGKDVFLEFSEQGASTNAFTSNTCTAYLFSCTANLAENLQTLLDFVQDPYFTDENVDKEKGIIAQELEMYQDDPGWRLYLGLLNGLYHACPVRLDIGGTVESIQKITKEDLYTCYNIFYHPSNMVLFVVGAADPREVFTLVRINQGQKEFGPGGVIKRFYPEEPDEVAQAFTELELNIGVPKVIFAFKEPKKNLNLKGKESLRQELLTSIALEAILGSSSPFYQTLYESGLIDKSFSHHYTLEQLYGFSTFGGNTRHPEKLISAVKEQLPKLVYEGIKAEDFDRIRKKELGMALSIYDSPESTAKEFINNRFNEIDIFTTMPILTEMQVEDANQRLREHFNPDRMAISLVRPLKKK